MRALLGATDANGTVRFAGSRDECEAFLLRFGMTVSQTSGWMKPGWLGSITFWRDQFHAAASRSDLGVAVTDPIAAHRHEARAG